MSLLVQKRALAQAQAISDGVAVMLLQNRKCWQPCSLKLIRKAGLTVPTSVEPIFLLGLNACAAGLPKPDLTPQESDFEPNLLTRANLGGKEQHPSKHGDIESVHTLRRGPENTP